MDNDEITVGIKTFFRHEKIKKCLESLENKEFNEIIVVDNGIITDEKRKVYNEAKKKLPLKIIEVEFDSGVGYITNKINTETKTPYLYIIDDDMEITTIEPLKEILEDNKELGGITGQLLENGKIVLKAGDMYKKGKTLIIENTKVVDQNLFLTKQGSLYFLFDYIRYPLLLRKECADDCGWDNEYITGFEHADFFWSHKKLGKWKFAITPIVVTIHNQGGSKKYLSYRLGKDRYEKSRKHFLDKFNLKRFIEKNLSLNKNLKEREEYNIKKSFIVSLPPKLYLIWNKIMKFIMKLYNH